MTQELISSPPIARKEHKETVHHGTALVDDYAWLRDKENPEVTAFLDAENAYAESVMAPPRRLARTTLRRDAQPHQADR